MAADAITCRGEVVSYVHGIARVAVDLAGRSLEVLARTSRRMLAHNIRVIPGDTVELEITPYDPRRGRIVRRLDLPRAAKR